MVFTITHKLKRGNARNWPGLIVMDPDALCPAAVWAQEKYEAEWKLNPVNSLRFVLSKNVRREMEIMGHEVEVQAAIQFYGKDEGIYRAAEARALSKYSDFRGISPDKIERDMFKKRRAALDFVRKNFSAIKRQT